MIEKQEKTKSKTKEKTKEKTVISKYVPKIYQWGFTPNVHLCCGYEDILKSTGRYIELEKPIISWNGEIPKLSEINNLKQNSQAWYELRKHIKGFGASAVGYALGFTCTTQTGLFSTGKVNYETSNQEFINTIKSKQVEFPKNVQFYMKWGQIHEDCALRSVIDHLEDIVVYQTGTFYRNINGLDYIASPDAICKFKDGTKGVIELKCPTPFLQFKENGKYMFNPQKSGDKDKMRATYFAQVQFQMLLTGTKKCIFCSWTIIGSNIFFIDFEEDWVKKALKFIDFANKTYKNMDDNLIPANPFLGVEGYHDFLMETVNICKKYKADEKYTNLPNKYPINNEKGKFPWIFKEEPKPKLEIIDLINDE